MSSLRSLLNVIDSTVISATVGVNTVTKLSTQPASYNSLSQSFLKIFLQKKFWLAKKTF